MSSFEGLVLDGMKEVDEGVECSSAEEEEEEEEPCSEPEVDDDVAVVDAAEMTFPVEMSTCERACAMAPLSADAHDAKSFSVMVLRVSLTSGAACRISRQSGLSGSSLTRQRWSARVPEGCVSFQFEYHEKAPSFITNHLIDHPLPTFL